MSKTITDLNTELEELEKRIKAISTSHSTLAQIIAVRDSLDQVKTCLNDLNQTISNDEEDASASDLSALAERVATLEQDLLAVETDLAFTQDDVSNLQTEISNINSSIGEQNTSITNLQSAQTSLQATQTNMQTTLSSQASTISSNTSDIANNTYQIGLLQSRMLTCENNVSVLTNGIDVGSLESRISALENADDIYYIRVICRKTVDSVIVGEIYLQFYSHTKASAISDVLSQLNTVNRLASGFLENYIVYSAWREDTNILGFCTAQSTITNNTLSFKRGINKYINVTSENWEFFVYSCTI